MTLKWEKTVLRENVLKLLDVFFYLKMAGTPSPHPKGFGLKKHCEIVIRSLRWWPALVKWGLHVGQNFIPAPCSRLHKPLTESQLLTSGKLISQVCSLGALKSLDMVDMLYKSLHPDMKQCKVLKVVNWKIVKWKNILDKSIKMDR